MFRCIATLSLAGLVVLSLTSCRVAKPGPVETVTAKWVKRHVTVGDREKRNPLPPTPETIKQGRIDFDYYCSACHGRDGQNTGVPFATKMSPPVPSLASKDIQRYTDGQLEWIVQNGVRPSGMPASQGILSDEEIWQIVVYLRHLPPAGSLGEPQEYSGDSH